MIKSSTISEKENKVDSKNDRDGVTIRTKKKRRKLCVNKKEERGKKKVVKVGVKQ
jgi:hypothetical protein